ncbi:LuxR C-terminal-related transcriptional regulator [Natronohydrobacter thiooxidans]|uniref:LuxR C-terminal-related transcriptional regulator n=1 Tax=Natronohydrobacter thiooxidans TaxID=87172 RepID=UPI003CCC0D45
MSRSCCWADPPLRSLCPGGRGNVTSNGLTTEQVADQMAISSDTENSYFNNTVAKFDAANRQHAASLAIRMGLI